MTTLAYFDQDRGRRRLLPLALLAALAPWAAAETAVEDFYLRRLLAWAEGSPAALEGFSDLQRRIVDHEAGFEVTPAGLRQYYGSRWHRLVRSSGASRQTQGRRLPKRGCLGRVQHHVDSRLAELDPEGLLPLAYFHHLLHGAQLHDSPWLAELSRERALWLGELYGQQAEAPGAVRGAVGILSAVADVLATAGDVELEARARGVYLRALELDPENAAGLYWSACLAERAGDYGAAVDHLEVLGEVLQGDGEVLLRLGVNRARTGRHRDAEADLEAVARDGPGWLRLLAYQELGRLQAERDPGRAAATLRAATAAFPGSARLALQLSVLERADWSASAGLAHGVVDGWDGDPGVTPRVLYGAPRRDEIDDQLAALLIAVERRRPALAAALAALLDVPEVRRLRVSDCRGARP